MQIKQFIEKAIEGGWESKISHGKDFSVGLDGEIFYTNLNENRVRTFGVGEILLDPKAWEAVGKVEGWGSGCNICTYPCPATGMTSPSNFSDECKRLKEHLTKNHKYPYCVKMHQMIDALVEGKTIEEFIKTL